MPREDRLCQLNLDGFESFAAPYGYGIRVVLQASLLLSAEWVGMTHTFSCCLYGLRRCQQDIHTASPMAENVTRSLCSDGLHRVQYDRQAAVAARGAGECAWMPGNGVVGCPRSPGCYYIRDAWIAEGDHWRGLPARLGKATLADALGDIDASRPPKVLVKKAVSGTNRCQHRNKRRTRNLL